MNRKYALKAVIFQDKTGDETWWVAQGLEHDISAQAKHMREAMNELCRMFAVQILASEENDMEPLKIPRAPERFWMMFNEGVRVEEKLDDLIPLPVSCPEPELRVYA